MTHIRPLTVEEMKSDDFAMRTVLASVAVAGKGTKRLTMLTSFRDYGDDRGLHAEVSYEVSRGGLFKGKPIESGPLVNLSEALELYNNTVLG